MKIQVILLKDIFNMYLNENSVYRIRDYLNKKEYSIT